MVFFLLHEAGRMSYSDFSIKKCFSCVVQSAKKGEPRFLSFQFLVCCGVLYALSKEPSRDRSLSAARSGAESFVRRVQNAMEMQGIDASVLKEYLLPTSTAHHEVRAPSREVLSSYVRVFEPYAVNATPPENSQNSPLRISTQVPHPPLFFSILLPCKDDAWFDTS